MDGFSEIIEINNPDSLEVYELPKYKKEPSGKTIISLSDYESKSRKGTKRLADSIGLLALSTFPYNGQLYHIVTDFKKTFLTKNVNGKFESIDTISNESLWTYNPEVFITSNKHYIMFFSNEMAEGYLDIADNRIKIVRQR